MRKLVLLLFLGFLLQSSLAQIKVTTQAKSPIPGKPKADKAFCATDPLHSKLVDESPTYQKNFDEMNKAWQKWAIDKANQSIKKVSGGANPTTQAFQDETLPVVFHRIVDGAATPVVNSITNADLITALAKLNNIYAGLATGSKPAAINTHVQFCMAQVDNFGAAITSNTYTSPNSTILDNTNQGQINATSNVVQSTNKFPTTKYINIYLVENIVGSVAGFAYMPPAHGSAYDGIYVEAQYLLAPTTGTFDLSYNMTVLAHEMGHYLGLFHTFGICNPNGNVLPSQTCSCYNNNCLFDGDMVCDTPPDFGVFSTTNCIAINTCTTDAAYTISAAPALTADVNDFINNYMDYEDWNCINSFTQGQINRMHFMIDEFVGPRNSLLHSNVCNAACANNTCTVTINPITTTTISGVYYPNTLLLSGPTVTYNFTGTTCAAYYNTYNWSVTNLANNSTVTSGTGTNINAAFNTIGNYRIILKASASGSNPLCYQADTLDIQVLPPPACPNNLDMSTSWGNSSLTNWQRIQYEGGWARTNNNSPTFTHNTTTVTTHLNTDPNGTTNDDPFLMTNNFNDPNFNALGINALPAGISNVMRVGRLITPSTNLPLGEASYVTYTFTPTAENSKIRVWYLGMKETDPVSPAAYYYDFATATNGAKTGFGFVCKYDFISATTSNVVVRGTTHTGLMGNYFMKNDLVTDAWNSPALTTTLAIGTRTMEAMSAWQYKDLDFSELICASPTITITFFSRADEASNPGFHHSYAYFGTTCLPGLTKNIDLQLPNKDISCMADVGASCTTYTLPAPNSYSFSDDGWNYSDLLNVTLQESYDGISFTNTPIPVGSNIIGNPNPILNLCKTPDNHPYKYYRITYKTLCETLVDTVTIFQGFFHTINDCAPNPMSGGTFINPPIAIGNQTVSPDQYVQYCGTTTLSLNPPCWWHSGDPAPEYQWQINYGAWYNLSGETNADLVLNGSNYDVCRGYRRLAKYYDIYCNNSTWIESSAFSVTDLREGNFSYTFSGPDVCVGDPATVNINNFYESNPFTCDLELNTQYSNVPITNTVSFSFFSQNNCAPTNSIAPIGSNPSILTYTYSNNINYNTLSPSYTFNNTMYTTNGTVYVLVQFNRYNCISTFTLGIPIKVKPSAIAGTITTSPCLTPTMSITGDNPNATGYYWEYSYNNAFSPALSLGTSTLNTLNISSSTFTAFPVYVRRVANGTTDCPNVAYSNTLTVTNNSLSLTASPNVTICTGATTTLSASGASSYSWSPVTSNSSSITVSPASTTIYTVTGWNASGCIDSKTISVTVIPAPSLTINVSSNSICSGNPVTLTGSGATSYTWTAGSFTSTANPVTVSPATTTVYTLTGQTSGGCIATQTVAIKVTPGPVFEVSGSSTRICAKGTTTLTASGGAGITYTWTPGGANTSSIVVSPSSTTIYTVTASNGSGCTTTHTIQVIVNPNPVISVTGNTLICSGNSTTLTASGASTYTWVALPSFTSTLNPIIVSPAVTTTGTVTGISSDGCIGTKVVTITVLPSPTVTVRDVTTCAGTPVTLSASGATSYTWTSPTFIGNPYTVNPSSTTIYTVTGSNGSCTSTNTVLVNVLNTTISVSGNTTICSGSTTTLTATGAGSYTWTPGSITGNTVVLNPSSTTIYTVTGTNGKCTGFTTVTVNVLPSPTVSISGGTFVCAFNTTTLTATGGGTYSWSPSGVTTSSNVTSGGVNTVTVTGSNGCTTVKSVTVNVGAIPLLSITPGTQTICAGSSATLTASGAPLYNWMPGNISTYTAVVSPSTTTVYTLTGTGKNGCSSTKTATVFVAPTPTANISGATTICLGSTATLTATGGGTYLWNTGSANPIIYSNVGGVYSVTVTGSNGCTSVKAVTITVVNPPVVSVNPANSTICSGTSILLTASGTLSYTWMPGSVNTATYMVTPLSTTVYTVMGKNKGACIGIATATVNVIPSPTVNITGNTKICSGNTTTLTASGGGTYLWNNGATTPSIVTGNAINTVTVTGSNGCKTVKSITITINPTPTITIIPTPSVVCAGSCATLTAYNAAGGPTAYTWGTIPVTTTIGTGSAIVVCPTSPQKYTVTASTKPGCSSTTSIKIGVVTNDPSFNIVSAQISGQPYYTNTVTPVVTNANLVSGFGEMYVVEEIVLSTSVTVSGTNSSLGTNPNPSCWWVYPNPLTFTGYNGTQNVTCPTSTPYPAGQFTNGKAYRITRGTWNDFCPWAQKSRIVYQSGSTFMVIDDNNSPYYGPVSASQPTARTTNNNPQLNVYPNPNSGQMFISLSEATDTEYSIEVYDAYGKLIFHSDHIEPEENNIKSELDLRKSDLKPGLYTINLKSKSQVYSKRIIIE